MIRVGLGRSTPSYAGLAPPYGPGKAYPELASLLTDGADDGAPNPAYAAVRAALFGAGLDAGLYRFFVCDTVADDFGTWEGVCGKDGQNAPVGSGSPTLRISKITVGGTSA